METIVKEIEGNNSNGDKYTIPMGTNVNVLWEGFNLIIVELPNGLQVATRPEAIGKKPRLSPKQSYKNRI